MASGFAILHLYQIRHAHQMDAAEPFRRQSLLRDELRTRRSETPRR
jgi:hypothetical protein